MCTSEGNVEKIQILYNFPTYDEGNVCSELNPLPPYQRRKKNHRLGIPYISIAAYQEFG